MVASANRESIPAKSVELYRRAYRILSNDAPAMWLYELRNVFGLSKRIRAEGIRPDAWWRSIDEWSVTEEAASN